MRSSNLDIDTFEEFSNPLDNIEDIMTSHDWIYERPADDELTVQVSGRYGHYGLTFMWQEEFCAMQFFSEMDFTIPKKRRDKIDHLLSLINQELWLGHFDVPEETGIPCFRYTVLFRGMMHSTGASHIEDLVEIALAECERYYSAFKMLSAPGGSFTDEVMTLALANNAGTA